MIQLENEGTTTILRLAHGRANALDLDLLRELDRQLVEFEAGDQRALVLTGTGSIFCAGVDLFRLLDEGDEYLDAFLEVLTSVLRRLYAMPKPVVAAINGHAIAGGCLLIAAADLRIMAECRGKVGVTELYVGVPFPPLGLEILRAAFPAPVVDDLTLTGRLCGVEECEKLGVVHRVVPADQLATVARETAEHLGSVIPKTFELTKRQLREPTLRRFDEDLGAITAAVREQWRDDEVRATIREFLDATVGKKG